VNGSLWTLEYEAGMYLALPVVLFAASVLSRHILPAALVALIALYHFYLTSPAVDGFGTYYYIHLGQFFLAGTVAYVYRDRISISTPLAMLCLAVTIAAAHFGGFFLARLLAGGYVLLWFAYGAPKIADPITGAGDLSYGIYIYAFPIQQIMSESFAFGRSWEGNMILSLPPTFLLAYLSWRLVEAPAMAARSRILAAMTRQGNSHTPPLPGEIQPAAAPGFGAGAQGTQ
jgi:peptidoglycan/LPS O-acetylase OafA/YrhL